VALLEATADAAVPAGMVSVDIRRAQYAVFEVAGLSALGQAWQGIPQAIGSQTAWEPYCGPKGCECATHPAFEYHAWDSCQSGKVLIYVPVRPARP
jgi:predicted transcriptional regulator YdeE